MKKILFIEDESALQKALSEMLQETGYENIQALDGETGLRMAKSGHPDLILLDLILPKKDGFMVLEELKKDPDTQDIPVLVLSNLERAEDIERAMSLGAKSYMVKTDYKISEVINKIREVLG
ncbi:MAG: response regulator [bacterium]|nr:response regulator [bacterium]